MSSSKSSSPSGLWLGLAQIASQYGIGNNKQTILGLLAATLLAKQTYQLLLKEPTKHVVPSNKRHELPTDPVKSRYVELGSGEMQYARLAADEHGGLRCFLVAKLKGSRVSKDNLARAAEMCQRKHPSLRCRLMRVNGKVVYEERDDLKINIRVVKRQDGETFRKVFSEGAEKNPTLVGPTTKSPHTFWLLQSEIPASNPEEEESEIVVDLAHFVMDGSGLALLMADVLQYTLENVSELPTYGKWPITQEEGLNGKLKNSFWQLELLLRRLWAPIPAIYRALAYQQIGTPVDVAVPDRDASKMNATVCVAETLTEDETETFIKKCKEKKVSVTCAVSAAYIDACAEYSQRFYDKPFYACTSIVADSRKLYLPPAPASDMSPHVWVLPYFTSKVRTWHASRGTNDTWALAGEIREYLARNVSDPNASAIYAEVIAFLLSQYPASYKVPLLNVSSWCASSPVRSVYGSDDGREQTRVLAVELLQNMGCTCWINLSLYTFVGKLTASVFAPTPRYAEHRIREISSMAGKKLRDMAELGTKM